MVERDSEKWRRLAARARHPRRLLNWLLARREREARPDRMRSLPMGVDIEPTSRCNLRCAMCQHTEPGWPQADMPVERFERILAQLPQVERIKLQGIGEPFLHERFFELVRLARRRHIRVSTITNGTTLLHDGESEKIVASGLNELRVSIDSATAEGHARRRPGADLERIIEGLRDLVERRGRSGRNGLDGRGEPWRLRLGIWCVGDSENIAELPALVDLAAQIGVEELTYQTDMTGWGKAEWIERAGASRLDAEHPEVARRFDEARTRAAERGLDLAIYTGNRFTAERPCFWPWESCFISASGRVTRCCILSDPRLHNFGPIEGWSFAAIWNSPEYQELRRAIRENRVPALCKECYRAQ